VKPLDPRLLRHASAVRPFVLACAALGALTAMLVLAQAELLAKTITWAFLDGFSLRSLVLPLGLLTLVVLARAGITWLAETTAHRAAARALSQLRETVIAAALRLGPRRADRSPAEVAALATHGVDRLEPSPRRLAQVAAVVGRSFPVSVAAAVAGVEDTSSAVASLLRAEIIRETRRFPELECTFRHGLLQQAALSTLTPTGLRELDRVPVP